MRWNVALGKAEALSMIEQECRQFWSNLFKRPATPVASPVTPSIATPAGPPPITVQPNDTLSGLGRQHGFDWREATILRDGQVHEIGPGGVPPEQIRPGDQIVPTPESLGHGGGVDGDVSDPSNGAQGAAKAAEEGDGGNVEQTSQTCPKCKVAVVVGHTSGDGGALSPFIGEQEFAYNTDIANRTLTKINEKGGGKVTAQIFNRVDSGGYSAEIATVYALVNTFLAEVESENRIAIELHYNAAGPTASYALTLYKGDAGFAQTSADKMAEIYGVRSKIKRYQDNPRGQATFIQGPTNTYLMEPFFGTHEASANIAASEAGRDQLAEVYADLLVDWIK